MPISKWAFPTPGSSPSTPKESSPRRRPKETNPRKKLVEEGRRSQYIYRFNWFLSVCVCVCVRLIQVQPPRWAGGAFFSHALCSGKLGIRLWVSRVQPLLLLERASASPGPGGHALRETCPLAVLSPGIVSSCLPLSKFFLLQEIQGIFVTYLWKPQSCLFIYRTLILYIFLTNIMQPCKWRELIIFTNDCFMKDCCAILCTPDLLGSV